MWIAAAVFSAIFAGITAILSKCGLKNANSDAATALRTAIVLVMAWGMAALTGACAQIPQIQPRSWAFLILSGMATGASWICYFKALSLGEVSKVAAVDKSSTVLSVLFALLLFPDERGRWPLKLVFLALIAAGTFLMTDLKPARQAGEKSGGAWFAFAALSAVFAAATSLLASAGIKNVDSNLATAIRTSVVLLLAWAIVFARKEEKAVGQFQKREVLFLVLSALATGASWLCYYYAISKGQVSVVVPVDRLSILITVLFSLVVFKEKLKPKAWAGLGLLTAGTVCMAIFA